MDVSLPAPGESHVAIGGHIPTYKGNPLLIAGYDNNAQRYTRSVEQYRYLNSCFLIKTMILVKRMAGSTTTGSSFQSRILKATLLFGATLA